jgi:hypothetical protein
MATLEVAGALSRYRCFPAPYSGAFTRRMLYGPPGVRVFAEEIIEYAESQGRRDIAGDLRHSIRRSLQFRGAVRELMLASYRLEQKSPLWAWLVRRPKRFAKRIGLGAGWLYSIASRRSAGASQTSV